MLNDPLASALSKILNAEKVAKQDCLIKPISGVIKKVFTIMNENGYIGSFKEIEDGKGKYIRINLLGNINRCGAVKPRYAIKKADFEKFEKRYLPAKGMGILIVSTPKGIMSNKEALKNNFGGRLIAYCY